MTCGRTGAESAAPILAIIYAAGLSGFAPADPSPPGESDAAAVDDVLWTIRAAGLPGFKRIAPRRAAATLHPRLPSALAQTVQGSSTTGPRADATGGKLSGQEYAILEIAPGGEGALTDLEGRMGRAFAADVPGGPCYSVASLADGGTARALYVATHQRLQLATFGGELGTPHLRLSFARICPADYSRSGPGAVGRHATGNPPQMAEAVVAALRMAMR